MYHTLALPGVLARPDLKRSALEAQTEFLERRRAELTRRKERKARRSAREVERLRALERSCSAPLASRTHQPRLGLYRVLSAATNPTVWKILLAGRNGSKINKRENIRDLATKHN